MIYQFGHHCLDTETVELKAGSGVVELEPQTFLLLSFLIENRDRVVSKDEIFEAVWEGRIVADSTLAFALNAVRKAVGDDGKTQAVIRTFPRRGFRFVAPVVEGSPEVQVQRRLAAILAADIVGYSALVGVDETGTVRALKGHMTALEPIIGLSGGRIFKLTGDGFLAEFSSVVDAVSCADAMQRQMAKRN